MKIYLMQHGLALDEEADQERPLSAEGLSGIASSARAMVKLDLKFDLIIASRKLRSRQTADIVAEATGYPSGQIVATESIKPSADADKILTMLEKYNDRESVLIVGHLPSLALLAGRLIAGESVGCIDFQNGGLGRIDAETLAPKQGRLCYYLPPEYLARIS